ncbi:HAD family hydrolase [uncultured Tateyamaria sp.]|uniref:HAD family hydrolase n=1 Tax=uncultured Tateyamaria sp. TaxID=455651 RepID=UPI00260DFBA5|nr:HAD family hydrolase [uncultured Tateyamaria sp.]
MSRPLIVWDFDGVLNANIVDGRFVWTDHLYADWGIMPADLSAHIFESGLIHEVLRGARDLRDVLVDWFAQTGRDIDADAFLAYWFAQDARPDTQVIGQLQTPRFRHVIGTNNETRRAAYIETEMGFGPLVERVFSSGRMGCAKPEAAYFAHIEAWSGLPPDRHTLIDDTVANVVAAKARGWRGFHFCADTRADLPAFLDALP